MNDKQAGAAGILLMSVVWFIGYVCGFLVANIG